MKREKEMFIEAFKPEEGFPEKRMRTYTQHGQLNEIWLGAEHGDEDIYEVRVKQNELYTSWWDMFKLSAMGIIFGVSLVKLHGFLQTKTTPVRAGATVGAIGGAVLSAAEYDGMSGGFVMGTMIAWVGVVRFGMESLAWNLCLKVPEADKAIFSKAEGRAALYGHRLAIGAGAVGFFIAGVTGHVKTVLVGGVGAIGVGVAGILIGETGVLAPSVLGESEIEKARSESTTSSSTPASSLMSKEDRLRGYREIPGGVDVEALGGGGGSDTEEGSGSVWNLMSCGVRVSVLAWSRLYHSSLPIKFFLASVFFFGEWAYRNAVSEHTAIRYSKSFRDSIYPIGKAFQLGAGKDAMNFTKECQADCFEKTRDVKVALSCECDNIDRVIEKSVPRRSDFLISTIVTYTCGPGVGALLIILKSLTYIPLGDPTRSVEVMLPQSPIFMLNREVGYPLAEIKHHHVMPVLQKGAWISNVTSDYIVKPITRGDERISELRSALLNSSIEGWVGDDIVSKFDLSGVWNQDVYHEPTVNVTKQLVQASHSGLKWTVNPVYELGHGMIMAGLTPWMWHPRELSKALHEGKLHRGEVEDFTDYNQVKAFVKGAGYEHALGFNDTYLTGILFAHREDAVKVWQCIQSVEVARQAELVPVIIPDEEVKSDQGKSDEQVKCITPEDGAGCVGAVSENMAQEIGD